MGKKLLLKAEIRENSGSGYAAKVRKAGRIPAIVYGHKQEAVAISLDAHNFSEGLHHGHRLVDVEVGGKKETMIVKDIQYDHLGRNIIHADLMRVNVTELIKISVPIEIKGIAKGTQEGGIVAEHTDHLDIECKVTNIPESIVVSVKELGVGDSIHAGDIELGSGIKLITAPTVLIVNCSLVAIAKSTEEVEEEVPAEPEVIGGEGAEEAGEEPEK